MIDRLCQWLRLSRRELAALAGLFLLSLPAVTPRLYSSDEVQYFSYLRSIWFDRDVSFENEYRYFYDTGVARTDGFAATFLDERRTPAGNRVNFGTIGSAILWAPFYAVGDLAARVMRAAGSDVAVDGFSGPYVAAVAYGSAVYGFLAILLGIRAARLLTDEGALAGLIVWLGTPLFFYMYAAPPFSHACSAFAVALFATVWLRVRREWTARGMIALGAAAALMAMVREQDAFFAIGPALDWALDLRRLSRQAIAAALAGSAAFAVCFTPQLVAYQALNGHPGPSTLVTRKMTWTAPHALDVLVSPQHGFFFWTPLAVLAVAGLTILAARPERVVRHHVDPADARRIGAALLAMVACQIYVSGSVESWTVAGAFGQRRFVALTSLLVVGLAVFWRAVPSGVPRAAAGIVLAAGVWWNVALMAEFATGMMDRQRLELRRNAYDAFVTLPRMAPELAWRYLTARESFYRPPAGNGR